MLEFPISSIFNSIQGEGSWMGVPATFIRFAGCNLKCSFCDTNHSVKQKMNIKQIISQINHNMVVLTGGEPTIHKGIEKLGKLLQSRMFVVALETNGVIHVDSKCFSWITVSPKGPNWEINTNPNELKYVVSNEFTVDVIPINIRKKLAIWLQPDSNDVDFSMKRCFNMAMTYEWLRCGIQMQKYYKVN